MPPMRWTVAAVVVAPIVGLSTPAAADPPQRLEWKDGWRRFDWPDYVGTVAAVGGTVALSFTPFRQDGFRQGLLFDDAVRDAFVGKSRAARDKARVVGDMFFRAAMVYPFIVDTVAVAWVAHGSPDVALQMFLINAQAFGVGTMLTLSTEHAFGRARPSTTPCDASSRYETFCNGGDRFGSFVSGHTAIAATSAALMCAHHQHLPLYGGGWPDALACIAGIGAATTVGVARLVNDRHWATDVLAGSAIGAFAGYVLPNWLYYGFGDTRSAAPLGRTQGAFGSTWTAYPWATPAGGGAGMAGMF